MSKVLQLLRAALLVIVLFLLGHAPVGKAVSPQSSQAQMALPPLFSVVADGRANVHDANALWAQAVTVDFKQLSATKADKRLWLNLFPDKNLMVTLDRVEHNQSGSTTWLGHVDGDAASIVIFVVANGQATGFVGTTEYNYRLQPYSGSVHTLAGYAARHIERTDEIYDPTIIEEMSAPTAFRGPFDSDGVIDVLLVYSQSALQARPNLIQNAEAGIAYLNQTFRNSQIDARFELVHHAPITFQEASGSGAANQDLMMLRVGNLEVEALKATYHADLVTLATVRQGVSLALVNGSYNVIVGSAAPFIWAHEWGHNLGSFHDWIQSPGPNPGAPDYALAHLMPEQGVATLMYSGESCLELGTGCTIIPYFSNPDVSLNGVPLGVPIGTDNTCRRNGATGKYQCDANNAFYFSQSTLASNGNVPTLVRRDFTASSEIIWTGAKSTDWHDPANWWMASTSARALTYPPRAIDDVHIYAGASNMPVITQDASVRHFIVEDGASLALRGGTLRVYGNWTQIGTSRTVATGGTVIFNGNDTQSIEISDNASFYNLQIGESVPHTVTLTNNLRVLGDLTIHPGAVLDAGNGHTLTVGGDWTDTSSGFRAGSSEVIFAGTDSRIEIGDAKATAFYGLSIGGSVKLNSDVMVNGLFRLVGGVVDWQDHRLILNGPVNFAQGIMRQTRPAPGGVTTKMLQIERGDASVRLSGLDITPDADMGNTTVEIRWASGACTENFALSVMRRCYSINPAQPQNATIAFWFTEAERNNQAAHQLSLWADSGVLTAIGSQYSSSESGPACQTNNGTACVFSAHNVDNFTHPFALGSGVPTDTQFVFLPAVTRANPATANVVNLQPVALNDTFFIPDGQEYVLDVLANDVDVNGDPIQIVAITQPDLGGAASFTGDQIVYRSANALGPGLETFTYTVSDGQDSSTASIAVVSGTPEPPNQAPVAVNDTFNVDGTNISTDLAVLVNDSDANVEDILTIWSASAPAHGSVKVIGYKIRYTPAVGYAGTDSFTYLVVDGRGGYATATVNLSVTASTR